MHKLQNLSVRLRQSAAAKLAMVGTVALATATSAMAQTADGPFDAFFDAIGLSGVTAKVVAVGVLIVGIALAFKGPDLAKRVVRKV
ncbi:MAG TPA: hypothetical protein VFE82_09105 [Ramlibacter sp.]|jgi:hypothetical protein|uniref:hypothetical protein n=1 Tax=Ramlibacter sp. TaxID=1917967 RepID=UPI002D5A998A|nr:hypothetical protein [Ramlibacter sp.]HZY18628.1 hypothetical protein [Ramlibacter sp.]